MCPWKKKNTYIILPGFINNTSPVDDIMYFSGVFCYISTDQLYMYTGSSHTQVEWDHVKQYLIKGVIYKIIKYFIYYQLDCREHDFNHQIKMLPKPILILLFSQWLWFLLWTRCRFHTVQYSVYRYTAQACVSRNSRRRFGPLSNEWRSSF